MAEELSTKALQDVHKAVFICNEYQDKTIREVASLIELSALDINAALWRAEDMGFITVDDEKRIFKINKLPEEWNLGEDVAFLRSQLLYAFSHMARSEADFEETYLSNSTKGYVAHDVVIVLKSLLSEGVIVTYDLTNTTEIPNKSKKARGRGEPGETVKDTYTFYTLAENAGKKWGLSQFPDQSRVE